jgi:hypothetical protein
MIDDIRKYLEVTPFIPFSVRLANGCEYPVPTTNHIYLPPAGGRVIISDDQGIVVVLPALLITSVAK